MPSSPNWKLRRLADRVVRIQARRGPENPALAAYDATLIPNTNAFIAAYDAASNSEAGWKKELKEGKGAIAALVKIMRSWLPSFTRDVAGFTAADFADKPSVPDDVMGDATRLLDAAAQSNKPWRASFEGHITPALQSAVKEWQEAESADAGYQRLLRELRATVGAFDAELQLYRVSLAAAFGTNDKDYQKLRADRAVQKDEEDSTPLAGGDSAGAPVEPGDPPPL